MGGFCPRGIERILRHATHGISSDQRSLFGPLHLQSVIACWSLLLFFVLRLFLFPCFCFLFSLFFVLVSCVVFCVFLFLVSLLLFFVLCSLFFRCCSCFLCFALCSCFLFPAGPCCCSLFWARNSSILFIQTPDRPSQRLLCYFKFVQTVSEISGCFRIS